MVERGYLDLTPAQLAIVLGILGGIVPEREVRVFGSRAKGTAKPYSDLDLAVMGETALPLAVAAQLNEAFSESELPFKVDVVEWALVAPGFREIIAPGSALLQAGRRVDSA